VPVEKSSSPNGGFRQTTAFAPRDETKLVPLNASALVAESCSIAAAVDGRPGSSIKEKPETTHRVPGFHGLPA